MIALGAGDTIQGAATEASKVTATITGSSVTAGVGAYDVLAQAQLPASAAAIYTVPGGKTALISHILLANTAESAQTVTLSAKGTGVANRLARFVIPALGSATFDRDGWKVYDGNGAVQTVGEAGAEGPEGPEGPAGATGATGEKGAKGDTGATGPKGDTGAAGAKGDTGAAGPEGPEGPEGEKGEPGDVGGAFTQTIGDGSTKAFTITHGLNTRAVLVSVRQAASPWKEVWAGYDAEAINETQVKITFDTAPTTNQYVVLIMSGAGPEGPEGPKGETGEKGAKGDTGATGPSLTLDSHTFAIQGVVTVTTIPGFFVGVLAGETVKLKRLRAKITGGTNCKIKVQKNGEDATGFTALEVTTTAAQKEPTAVTLADNDVLTIVIESVSGSPVNLSASLMLERSR